LVCWILVLSGLVLLGLVWCIYNFLLSLLCGFFSWLGVQGGHSFEPIYWLFAVADFSALSLTFPRHWSLAYPDSCEGKCFVITFVVEGGLLSGQRVCAGMVVLNPEYQDVHNQENQSYIGASCGFSLTYQSEIRKFQGLGLGTKHCVMEGEVSASLSQACRESTA